MSSNIKITRVCQNCGNEFVARTTVTRCCSDSCAKRFYKQKQKQLKIEKSEIETNKIRFKPIKELSEKEFLTVRDASLLLRCSIRTAYQLISSGKIKAVNISQRKTLIRRTEIDKLFL